MDMYREIKLSILDYFGVMDTTMHLVIGLAIYVIVFAALRRPWLSLWILIGIQLGNELIDIHEQHLRGFVNFRQSISDTAWTILIPTVIAALLDLVIAARKLLSRRLA